MSLRIDTTDLFTDSLVIGVTGHGIPGASIPYTGQHGASVLYKAVQVGDEAKEFRAVIVTPPSLPPGGTFFMYEDGSVEFTGLIDGTYSFTYRLFVDGADMGTATTTVTVGTPPPPVSLTVPGIVQSNSVPNATVIILNPVTLIVPGISQINSLSSPTIGPVQTVNLIIPGMAQVALMNNPIVTVSYSAPGEGGTEVDAYIVIRSWPFIQRDLSRFRGDTFPDEFSFLNSENLEPLDMTGYQFTLTVSSSASPTDTSTVVYTLSASGDSTGVVEITPSESQADRVGYFYYDLQAIDPQGRKRTVAAGKYVYKQDITK